MSSTSFLLPSHFGSPFLTTIANIQYDAKGRQMSYKETEVQRLERIAFINASKSRSSSPVDSLNSANSSPTSPVSYLSCLRYFALLIVIYSAGNSSPSRMGTPLNSWPIDWRQNSCSGRTTSRIHLTKNNSSYIPPQRTRSARLLSRSLLPQKFPPLPSLPATGESALLFPPYRKRIRFPPKRKCGHVIPGSTVTLCPYRHRISTSAPRS